MTAVVQHGMMWLYSLFVKKNTRTNPNAFWIETEKRKIKENRNTYLRNELSPLQVLVRNTTIGLQDLALATIHADSNDSSSGGESQRNTADYTNADTVSNKSGSK